MQQVAGVHDGQTFERAGRKMVLFDSERSMQGFIDNIRTLNVSYTNDLRDALVARLRAAGVSVNTDWQAGERVLAQENGKHREQVHDGIYSDEFKQWFGDWEKTARIQKLRVSEPVKIKGDEYVGKYDLNRDSAKAYIKANLRQMYTIEDTGESVLLAKDGAQKVTSHSMGNVAHLKSIAVIPDLLRKAIYIMSLPNEKDNEKYDSYRYYVVGLNINSEDFTVKIVIGVDANGNKYYDHSLTEIEKGKLIDKVGALSTTLPSNESSLVSGYKDTRLFSILQTNSSKILKNGVPMVFYHGTNVEFDEFDLSKSAGMAMFTSERVAHLDIPGYLGHCKNSFDSIVIFLWRNKRK